MIASRTSRQENRVATGAPEEAARDGLGVWLFRAAVLGLFRALFRVRVVGLHNVPEKPAIICANHLGWSDVFMVLLFFPRTPKVYVLGEQEVREISSFRKRVIDWLGIMVRLDRSHPVRALRTFEAVLAKGGSVLIFPEGHLGTEEGVLHELQPGAAHAAVVTGGPLLPVGLTGTSELWLRRSLTMRIGRPIYPEHFEGDVRTRVREMTAHLDASMRALLPGDSRHPRLKLLRKWLTGLL